LAPIRARNDLPRARSRVSGPTKGTVSGNAAISGRGSGRSAMDGAPGRAEWVLAIAQTAAGVERKTGAKGAIRPARADGDARQTASSSTLTQGSRSFVARWA